MSRSRPLIGLAAVSLLAVPVALATPAVADKPVTSAPDYTIALDPTKAGAELADSMYGVFFEDINFAADGGLYAELVRNRSFEFLPNDHWSYNGMTAWSPTATGGGTGTVRTVNGDARMNERNRTYLEVDLTGNSGTYGVTNSGFNTGVAVKAGATYDFSVWARTTAAAGTPLTVSLQDTAGKALAAPVTLTAQGDTWTQYKGTFTATATSDAGRLSVLAAGTGTLRLDMVSLFPEDTFKGRENGLRKDLAEKVAALKPGFLRFPGGCIVNVNSHSAYDEASNYERNRSYQWKDSVGPVEERATNANFWGYNQSYGLGYFEYFQFAEDIGAMPVPDVPALLNGCGQTPIATDPALLQRHIQDTLDLIEFANGDPATSEWAKLRADMGHPAPFGLTHLEVGNEENFPEHFMENFKQFRDAIKAKYPEIVVISNSGPDDEGRTFDVHWAQNKAEGVEMVDEHYYNTPTWFLQNNKRYDSYDRSGPDVWVGEYASLDNKLANALAEGAFMTGLERNGDVVKMASYAPLLANVDHVQWRPDMIWFDNDESWNSASYEVQKLFMNNVGDRVVPSVASGKLATGTPITGSVGLSTWSTAARYDDVKVTDTTGKVLLEDTFGDGSASDWTSLAGRGTWSVNAAGEYVQSDQFANDTLVRAPGTITATDYDYTVKATKTAGAEGFLIGFGVKDSGNFYWLNLGGWGNTRSVIEKATNGAKETVFAKEGHSITTGKTYDVKVSVRGSSVSVYLDGQLFGAFAEKVAEPFAQVITKDDATGDLLIKVVNAQSTPAVTQIDLGGRKVASRGTMTVVSGDPAAQNTRSASPIVPVTSTISGLSPRFTRTFPAHSATIIRVSAR
jgi:alpha-L-arabinofuranosidase